MQNMAVLPGPSSTKGRLQQWADFKLESTNSSSYVCEIILYLFNQYSHVSTLGIVVSVQKGRNYDPAVGRYKLNTNGNNGPSKKAWRDFLLA